jgi:predicted transposase/invertase (TIGR01784 family)
MEAYMKKIQFSEDEALFDICIDGVFKSIFTRETPDSRGALNRLLSAILEKDLRVIAITANEPPIGSLRERQIRFDINVELETGQHANVEITMHPDEFETLRMEYYVCKLLLGQSIKGKDSSYEDLKATYQISIIEKERFFDDNKLVHRFEYYDKGNHVSLNGRTAIVTLELQKAGLIAKKPIPEMTSLERWSLFFRYFSHKKRRALINGLLEQEEGIAMAGAVVSEMTQEQIEYLKEMSREKQEVGQRIFEMRQRKIQEALDKERKAARKKALIEGREQGHEDILALLDPGIAEQIRAQLRQK